ncbi:transposase [Streptococcus moroccensis]|uniref:Transposase n=1 Tax=Streptococcus moroccensis TaxID=1451356 RepID=A0ABT9YVI0_9STRE|nr:transposase [Streptococcus moroccensis]
MRVVFGIDVSKTSSEVAIVINGEKIHGYSMTNDVIGFSRLLEDLKTVSLIPRLSLNQLASILVVFKPFLRTMTTHIHG